MCQVKQKRWQKIKRSFWGIIIAAGVLLCLMTLCEPCLAADPWVSAGSAILYDRVAKEIVFAKDAEEQRPPASTTKILTAIMALEMASLDEEVVISSYAASMSGTSLYLREGEVWTINDLLWGTLLKSGNDGAVALAEGVAGSETLFVELMNKKAFLLGAGKTHFMNTNGLPNKEHLTTSYDLAMMADYALRNPLFAEIVKTKETVVSDKNSNWNRNVRNTNQLLGSFEGANGVKTGTTNAAGQCLVASAERGSRRLIAVVLKSGDRYGDTRRLLNHGFDNTHLMGIPKGTVVGKMYFEKAVPYQVDLITSEECFYIVSEDRLQEQEKKLVIERPNLPVIPFEKVGDLEIKANQKYRIPVCAADGVRRENIKDSLKKICICIF